MLLLNQKMAAPMFLQSANIQRQILQILWRDRLSYRKCSILKKSIKAFLQSEIKDGSKQRVIAEGWLKSLRRQKKNTFFHLNDGSCQRSLQVVSDTELCPSELCYGSSVRVEGDLVPSPAKGQSIELQASRVQVHGLCDSQGLPLWKKYKVANKVSHLIIIPPANFVDYPFIYKGIATPDFLRGYPHLRPRMDYNSCLLRVRNAASMAVHKFFQENQFMFIHTPTITSNDCEGAGEVFTVQGPVSDSKENKSSDADDDQDSKYFFGHPVFLTVSGQLHLEAITGAFKQAYSFGPTFRAENAKGRHHLCEFYMIEAEIAFTQTLECIMKVMEELLKKITADVISQTGEDVDYYRNVIPDNRVHLAEELCKNNFERLSYTDGIKILEKNSKNFEFKVSWGCDLQKEHEQYLVQHCDNTPVFVTDFPATIKPFYSKANSDGETVAAVDLLVPGCGELFGGSLREDEYQTLKTRMDTHGLTKHYEWYLDLRKFGSVPHGGFGMGFERYLQFLLGIPNIKDTIPFPRWSMQCKL